MPIYKGLLTFILLTNNEKYVADVVLGKTYIIDVIQRKNRGDGINEYIWYYCTL